MKEIVELIIEKITIKFIFSMVVGSIATYAIIDKQSSKNENTQEVAQSSVIENEKREIRTSKHASPPSSINNSSHREPIIRKSNAKFTSFDQSNFVNPENASSNDYETNSSTTGYSSSYKSLFSDKSTNLPFRRDDVGNDNLVSNKSNAKTSEQLQISPGATTTFANTAKTSEKKETVGTTSNSNSATTLTASPIANSCSSNIVGGSFGNPIGITLSCTYPSTIKFCLSKDNCCDPESGGTTYNTQVVVGKNNGNYCLSYMGDSDTGGNSIVYQQNYTINSTLPNLTVGHSKLFYQATELDGASYIVSQDFGKANYSVGQINLKTHDPGPNGLNYDCDEIISNYVNLVTPTPIEVLSLFDVSLAPKNVQVEIPMRADQIIYGDNYITSYIENNNFVAPIYSCSTTKINLEDFEYFQSDASLSEVATNSVREFESEFSSYGFFEKDIELVRNPAGVNSEENAGENLKSGIFGMFY